MKIICEDTATAQLVNNELLQNKIIPEDDYQVQSWHNEQNYQNSFYDIKIGRSEFFRSEAKSIESKYNILIYEMTSILSQSHLQHSKINAVVHIDDLKKNHKTNLSKIVEKNLKQQQLLQIRQDFSKKTTHLEQLNRLLAEESIEKNESVLSFADAENKRKLTEKKLLYFLDFANAELDNPDFIEKIFKLMWMDIIKNVSMKNIYFFLNIKSENAIQLQFNGSKMSYIKNTLDIKNLSEEKVLREKLANLLQKPIGVVNFWKYQSLELDSLNSLLVIEYDHLKDQSEINNYFSVRSSLLSLLVQNHIFQQQSKYHINKWNQIVKAHKDPVVVIDENFNLVFSADRNHNQEKCYQVLASRNSPCVHCPIIEKSNGRLIQFNEKLYSCNSSHFEIDQKYFVHFYSDQSIKNEIKYKAIQYEKMNVIGQLANHLAHELNNPLAGIRMACEWQMKTLKNENIVRDLNEIYKASVRCQEIIKDLLDFSYGKIKELKTEAVDEVVKKTLTLLKSVMRNHSIFVDVKSEKIQMHSNYIQQIIFNLVKNACEAGQEKKYVKIYSVISDKIYDLIVEDNGTGLPESIKQNIFQPFSTTKDQGQGTGLGLFLSSQLAKKSNAELIYDDKFKTGARFILRFSK